ncbi:hypothetical protein GCK72_023651 [Caenorhabditis remanei]|uniref:Uncharacterized protein n=1 Tax=Caenorhabditis remanei TaxID=31234 RepID=A0A6A5FWX5_CAERE|nr:hypothetical protein GCK72_023651 [Caenorhabditis remanei]KAF1747190.1 hypothetical protein GCK72_023651 [Caenorhabditis remanei]
MENNENELLLPPENQKKYSNFTSFSLVVWKCTSKLEKFLFLLGIASAVLTGLCQPFMSYTFGEVSQVFVKITSAVNNKTIDPSDLDRAYEIFHSDMNTVVIHFALVGFAFAIFGFLQFSLFKYVGDNTTYRVRKEYITRLLRKDAKYFDTVSTGSLSTILNDNLERFREAFNEKIAFIICFTTDFIIGTSLAFYTDWRLASYGSVFAVGIAFSGFINSASMMGSTGKQNTHYANAGAIAFQALSSFKTVISLNGQKQELERYSNELKAGEKHGSRRAFFLATSRSVTHFFCNALNGIILYVGADLIYNKTMDQAVIVTLFHYMLFSAFSLGEAFPHLSYLSNAISSASPIFQILTSKDDVIENRQTDHSDDQRTIKEGNIKFEDVRFSYPSRPDSQVLKGVTFNVKKGECIALVGGSGSGKSTIVQLLLHYYDIDSGKISIDGLELNNINLKELRRAIGVVSQEPVLFNTTIEENIRFGNSEVSTLDIYEALKTANAYDFVCAFPRGIKTVVGERGAQLSGGQKQRIAIARVLVKNPKILLLDEATSALDNESEREVQIALRKASEGRTTIVIAHRLSTIRNCDKIMVTSEGKIAELGNHDELIARGGLYKDLIQAQFLDSAENQGDVNNKKPLDVIAATSNDNRISDEELENILKDTPEEQMITSSIWEILRECRPNCILLFFAIFGSAIQGFSFPILAQLIVSTYKAYAMDGEEILINGHFWASMFLVLGLFRPITLYCQYFFFGKVGEKLSTHLRIKSFQHLLSLPCAFYDESKNSPTRLANRLNTDASNVKAAVDARLGSVLMTLVSFMVAITIACYYSWKLTMQVLLFFPVLYLAKYCYEKTTVQSIKQDSLAFEKSNKIAVEVLDNIKTVRSLNMEEKVLEMMTVQLRELKRKYHKRAFVLGLASGFSAGCSQFVYALSFKFGTYLILQKEVLPMDMYLALVTLSYTSNMAGSAISYLPDYKKAIHAAGLIFNLFTYPATMPYKSKDGQLNIDNGEVKMKDVKFHYHQRPDHIVLKSVNLLLEPGKTLALVGPSGSGKSTVVSLIELFYRVDNGSIDVDGENVENVNMHHLRSSLALVSQEPSLFNSSIRENLVYGLTRQVHQLEMEKALITANAFRFVFQFPNGLDTIVGERGAQLSGGQKQRIAIARAILRNPKVLLLDEATSALDSENEKVVQNALNTASERLSTIIVAHRLSTIANADSIAVIKLGKVVEQGSHEELLKLKGAYYKLVQKQEN